MGTCKKWEEDDQEAREEQVEVEEAGEEDALLLNFKTKTPLLLEPETRRRLTVTVETKRHTSKRRRSRHGARLHSRARCRTLLGTPGGTARTAPLFRC
jgi:hypothetical protein